MSLESSPDSSPPLPRVAIMMAMSADGKIASHAREAAKFTSNADLVRLERVVSKHNALIMGSGTLKAYGTTFPVRDPVLLEARRNAGLPPQPITAIVTNTLDLPIGSPFFAYEDTPRLLITTETAAQSRSGEFDGLAEIVVAGEKEVDPVAALTHLSKRDATRVLALGGGAFNFTLFDLDLVDDYYLTLVPTIIGGQTAPTPVDGRGLKIDERKSLTLVDWRQEAQEIFLHYQVL